MKRTPLKKKSKQSISLVQRKVWERVKWLVRERYGNKCYTCGRSGLSGSNWHTGHMWPKAALGAYLKYDMRVLRPQCYNCNINLGGNGAVFYAKMLAEIGSEAMEQLVQDRQTSVKAMEHYLSVLLLYNGLIEESRNKATTR